jgi:dienelactone hydrolase
MGISVGGMPVERAFYPGTIPTMELVTEPFDLEGAGGERVRGEIRRPADSHGALPVVFVLHGFKAFRKWGFFPWFGERIASLGFASVTFDFSHNGTDATGEAYPRRDLFRATHLADLDALTAALQAGKLPRSIHLDPARVAFVGHSMGGGLAVLMGHRYPGVRCIAGLAPVHRAARFTEREKATWREKGEMPIVNSRTGEILALGLDYLDDAEMNAPRRDCVYAAARLPCPLLVIHGENDTSVPVEEGRSLAEAAIAAGRAARFALVPGTQHTFDCGHPFAGETTALLHAWKELEAFLTTYLVRFDPNSVVKAR